VKKVKLKRERGGKLGDQRGGKRIRKGAVKKAEGQQVCVVGPGCQHL